MKNFILIGAASYIAPRHFKAIKETKNNLLAAMDKFDSVGILDSYFPKAAFFTEFERFDRHIEKINRTSDKVDFVSVCTPNYLHDSHIRFGLRHGADVICEKPLVLNPWNIDSLEVLQRETGKTVYNIFQLRLHPAIQALREKVMNTKTDKKYELDLTYITSRGNWYYTSWKGDINKSGGIATNIGVHFFDMLTWIFGGVQSSEVHIHTHDRAAGFLELENARVKWFLSINEENIPANIREQKKTTYRSIQLDGQEIEFSEGFTDLHTVSYQNVLDGKGFPLMEAKRSIEIVHDIRTKTPIGLVGEYHPFCKLPLAKHPFE
ncbi:MAG: Gfo/Idh/MocA family oxidoreductase [Chitinophagales bacterium]|nr:Gfo/Idh/MocA family oxidoreductase [Chitinophagales bacterium]